MVWPNIPVQGRNRVYEGRLPFIPVKPGPYELLLRSKEMKKEYLPTRFKIEARTPNSIPEFTLSNTPNTIADLKPGLPGEVKRQLIQRRASFKAIVKPEWTADGELRLRVEFKNHALSWRKRDMKIVFLREKRLRTSLLTRVR